MLKDYYQILSVPRDADENQIKKAYRRLAQEWHPDKHNQDEEKKQEAEEKFKEISEAYAVLSDSEKKTNYDATGDPNSSGMHFRTYGDPLEIFRQQFGFRHFGFREGPNRPQPTKGQSIQKRLDVSLKEALFGGERSFSYNVNSSCGTCEGRGGTEFELCSECKGAGMQTQRGPNVIMQTTCQHCRGDGQKIKTLCESCNGRGVVDESKTLNVKIPEGIRHGMTLRIPDKGGRGFQGGPPGDILLAVNLQYPDLSGLGDEEKEQLEKLLSK
jgi:molecular chaperone DnaJ